MKSNFSGWDEVAAILLKQADECEDPNSRNPWLNEGQCASLRAIADRIAHNGVIIADEVGMGKTRIAVAVAAAVVQAGGRVAIAVPPGLGFQWEEELRSGGIEDVPAILRSLWAYLEAWESDVVDKQQPWFERSLLLVSHAFANWRLGDKASSWRRALLPEVYAQWQRRLNGQFPRFYHNNKVLDDPWTKNAGKSITSAVPLRAHHPGKSFLNKLLNEFHWTGSLEGDYGKDSPLRAQLEKTVGLGLGVFDLVIIDEAHKSRGTYTGLSRLLNTVLFTTSQTRTICMTATPVELDATQWSDPLTRIGLGEEILGPLQKVIAEYAESVRQLRQCWRGSTHVRENYNHAARAFQEALSPYVLRRDKREDEHVQNFGKVSQLDISQYRREREILVNMIQQPRHWKVAVCGAEALSVTVRSREDSVAQRLRLTLGNGHGIAAFLDESTKDVREDKKQEAFDAEMGGDESKSSQNGSGGSALEKRLQRCEWWHGLIKKGFKNKETALFDHPGILAAVDAIEDYTAKGEKTLVFGRFTKPMSQLTSLLNAREMLRRIQRKEPWPQQQVSEDEWPAVRAAWQQLNKELDFGMEEVDRRLETKYRSTDRARERFRALLIERLGQGLGGTSNGLSNQYSTAYQALCRSAGSAGSDDLVTVAHALMELLGGVGRVGIEDTTSTEITSAFKDIDADGDGSIDESEVDSFWETLLRRIKEEYGTRRSGFARFMFGETSPSSRRLIQQAFNRVHCFPMVLVAQSMVGREGLNLHRACRTVILLHPEWNPGIVEQQIGRVDRVSSLWTKALNEAIERGVSGDELPRIEVLPIVFQGTYDEYNWSILRRRWDDLRAQLHGIVIPNSSADEDEEGRKIIDKIMGDAPHFSPLK
jgi:hypothetical protein